MPTIFRRSLELFVRAPVVGLALGFALVLGAVMLSTGSFLAFFSIERAYSRLFRASGKSGRRRSASSQAEIPFAN